jgi:serine/threonine-protein kinase HipA
VAGFDRVEVLADLESFAQPKVMGALRRQAARGGEVFSFEYDPTWLEHPNPFSFDPDLALVIGSQYPATERANFGIFLDSSPDRWGRLLMERRESLVARRQGRRPRNLTEWDYLLGVHDETRLGALRFRSASNEPFLDSSTELAAPPIARLSELQDASTLFEASLEEEPAEGQDRWLSLLFAPGSSLGGARPKASVRDTDSWLCLAKFPSRQDRRDIGAWETLAHRLAARAGIIVAESRPLRLLGSRYTTFLVRRFDRTPAGRRRAFVSAMTLTQRSDGDAGASYFELVDLLQSRGAAARTDSEQLFRRVVFSILIHNTDDHLRNHGFFLEPEGIRLAPAYDLNPSLDRHHLSLAINEVETTCDVAIAREASQGYGLTPGEADVVIAEVRQAVAGWRGEAVRLGIPKQEQDLMAAAFGD